MLIFTDNEIENRQIKIDTKNPPKEEWLKDAYEAEGYDELLRTCGGALNLNHTSLAVSERLSKTIPEKFWNDKDIWKRKILDPFGDSGFLEKYLIKRLVDNYYMKKKFPDYGMRVFWILHNMIFSVAKNNASSIWLRKVVYYSSDATISSYQPYEVCSAIFDGKLFSVGADKSKTSYYKRNGNIRTPLLSDCGENDIFNYPMLDWIKSGKPIIEYFARVFWDVFTREDYDHVSEDRRKRLMDEITKKLDGYFDVIIGNPPYNTNDKETGDVAETVYQYFCMAADELHPKYEAFIIPSKWLYGKAKMTRDFPQSVLNNKNVHYLELLDGNEAFPSVDTGEISIYSKDNTKECTEFTFNKYGEIKKFKNISDITYEVKGNRYLHVLDSIVDKIEAKITKSLADDCKKINPVCGIVYDNHGSDLLANGAIGFKYDYDKKVILPDGNEGKRAVLDYSLSKTDKYSMKFYISKVKLWKKDKHNNHEYPNDESDKMMTHIWIDPSIINDYKGNKFEHEVLVTTTTNHYHKRLLDYPYNAFIMKPGEMTAFKYAIGASLTTSDCIKNLQNYLKTNFVTYLIAINQVSHNFSPESLRFVPYMDFTQEWTDEKLNKFFDLNEEEIKRINDMFNTFTPMRKAQMQKIEETEAENDESEDEE